MRMPHCYKLPSYNIVKTGEYTYDVELALAGFSKDDIEVPLRKQYVDCEIQAEG